MAVVLGLAWLLAAIQLLAVAIALAGIAYQVAAAVIVGRKLQPMLAPVPHAPLPPVILLRPLHGLDPRLADDLEAGLLQDWPGEVRLVCGVQRADDPAIGVVEALAGRYPGRVTLVVDAVRHGGNAKISNLANMMAAIGGIDAAAVYVLADSDVGVQRDWLGRVMAALAAPGTGAVTCLYHGRVDAGVAARFGAMGISWGFLPSVAVGLALGLAKPCMGSTIALRGATLAAIGGLAAFADVLADDHAIGMAVRGQGLAVAVPGFTVAHGCAEPDMAALVAHELRWNLTLRRLDPGGFAGFGLVNPLPFALLAAPLLPLAAGTGLLVAALAARALVAVRVTAATGVAAGPLWWLPARDLLGFALLIASFGVRTAQWRGSRLAVAGDGRIAAAE